MRRKAKQARGALESFVFGAFGLYDFLEGLERGDKTTDAAERALRRGKKRARAVKAAIRDVDREDP